MALISANVRRAHYGALAVVLIAATLTAAVLAGYLGAVTSRRVDLTATRMYSLSPRTLALLDRLGEDEDVEIVVSAASSRVSGERSRRVVDVLSEFARASESVTLTVVDTGDADAAEELSGVVSRLRARSAERVERHEAALERAAEEMSEAALAFDGMAALIEALGVEVGEATAAAFAQQAETVRDTGEALERAAVIVEAAGSSVVLGVAMPDASAAVEAVAPMDPGLGVRSGPLGTADAMAGMIADQIGRQRAQFAGDSAEAGRLARELVSRSEAARALTSAAMDRLLRLGRLEALNVSRLLERADAVVVSAAEGSVAVRLDRLFPEDGGVSAAFAGEEIVATAIATVTREDPPIVVLVHGEPGELLGEGASATMRTGEMNMLLGRWVARRIDVVEWNPGVSASPPDLSAMDPSGDRPVVWFFVGEPSMLGLDGSAGRTMADRARRLDRLGDAARELIDRGENIVVSAGPSPDPSVGAEDALSAPFVSLGLRARSGRPLLTRVSNPGRGPDFFNVYRVIERAEGETAVGAAVGGQRVVLSWAVPIELERAIAEGDGVELRELLVAESDEETWGEARWMATGLRYANRSRPFEPVQPGGEAPTRDPERDLVDGPWVVAATAERATPRVRGSTNDATTQRVLMVGAGGWYQDLYTQRARLIDGRRVFSFPGNLELVEAAVSYAAHDDELIAPSARSRDIPRVGAGVGEGTLAGLGWLLRLGLPGLALAGGVVVWLVRR